MVAIHVKTFSDLASCVLIYKYNPLPPHTFKKFIIILVAKYRIQGRNRQLYNNSRKLPHPILIIDRTTRPIRM